VRIRGVACGWIALWLAAAPVLAAGDSARGARAFGACAACHTLDPGRHLTGPSLAGMWDRKAAALESFPRYSSALKGSGIVWNERTLDAWIANPQQSVPGNYMLFRGIADERTRADLVAFLRAASAGGERRAMQMPVLPDLKQAPSAAVVTALRHCGDTYFVTNGDGETIPYWEFNLRFKTDSSASGPAPERPALVGQGMQGDRAQVVFARFQDISAFIREDCSRP
jgi:cytochrome c